jgi:acyl-CoA oxidase
MSDFTASLKPAEPQGPALLAAERGLSTIDDEKLANHLFHRGNFLEKQKVVLAVLEKRPIFSKKNLLNLSRPERFHLGLARAKEMRRLSVELGWGQEEYQMAMYLTDELSPYALHTVMFQTSVREQCNQEQKAYWTPKVENWEIIGAYGQTELGHGRCVFLLVCSGSNANDK